MEKTGKDIKEKETDPQIDVEQFFRPSCRSILNRRLFGYQFFDPYYQKTYDEINLPPSLLDTPENMLLNYFSILREAENLTSQLIGGCGTVGEAMASIPDRVQLLHQILSTENALFILSILFRRHRPYQSN